MRIIKKLIFIIVCLLLNSVSFISANAINTGFATTIMSNKDINNFLSSAKILLIHEEPACEAISCFDVAEYGMIAVGVYTTEEKMICVYNSDGVFQYGYEFYCNGSFGLQWDADNINIYFVRSDVAVSLTPNGNVVDVELITDSYENTLYWQNSIFTKTRASNENTYLLRNNMGVLNTFMASYSQLVKVDKHGNSTMIYDASPTHNTKFILSFVFVILILCIAVSVIILQIIKFKKDRK